ncbi:MULTISPECIES: hypothetical protein [Rhodococcus erythropolis group]|jgi:multisubunit Na+/H+ antiporter MnhG subunit|uniref:Uncharacterized protein n=1 Tax=Rhodococcus baikonurensis TaxID=172041 RepID=A0ABV5XFY3_9NOCA|nr:hypothetical protein [Rhodococcus qingshengii]KLN71775.1 hypothetical protein ABM90_10120 [Rhodococcus erythropolis]MBP1054092.1 hypothetical protein [Rhodococcus qingshengii]
MITNFTHRAHRATTVTTLAGIAMITGFLDRASGSNRRRSDRGSILEYVIIAAGVTLLAIAVVNYIGPVVMRYLNQIQ